MPTQEGNETPLDNAADILWRSTPPGGFLDAIAPMCIGQRPVGLFCVDKPATAKPITEDECRGFIQFVSQAKLALKATGRKTS